jgi:eukaryotic-like serine/threonine-protein kinase
VYRAHDIRLGRDVAIKTLPDQFARNRERVSRLRREARTLASLNHPHVAAIYGLEEFDGNDFLVLELVKGQHPAGPLPIAEVLRIGEQIAEALATAHARGIVHRDLKPANVMITPEGQVKVLDFGLAKAVYGHEDEGTVQPENVTAAGSVTGHVIGTPAYMSPEQARGEQMDPRTDVWSFGCLLYELLTGERAFRANTVQEAVAAVLEREPDWRLLPAKTPAKVRQLLRHCLQKDANQRLATIDTARKTIEQAQVGVNRWQIAGALGLVWPPSPRSLCGCSVRFNRRIPLSGFRSPSFRIRSRSRHSRPMDEWWRLFEENPVSTVLDKSTSRQFRMANRCH